MFGDYRVEREGAGGRLPLSLSLQLLCCPSPSSRLATPSRRSWSRLFKTRGHELNLYSSAVRLNTQYMHAVHFSIRTKHEISLNEALARLTENKRVALTEKLTANEIFSFGREHGHYGRILSHTVLPTATLARDRGLLLHAAGWQFIAIFDCADIAVAGSGQRG